MRYGSPRRVGTGGRIRVTKACIVPAHTSAWRASSACAEAASPSSWPKGRRIGIELWKERRERTARELGLRDLTLFAIPASWARLGSPRGPAGPGSITLVAAGGRCVSWCRWPSRGGAHGEISGAGGLYLWTRGDSAHGRASWFLGLLDGHGRLFPARHVLHGCGPSPCGARTAVSSAGHLGGRPSGIALWHHLVGMRIGKWTENIGGTAAW